MDYDTIFLLLNLSVVPGWLLLAVLPGSKATRLLVHTGLYPIGLGLFYIVTLSMSMFFGMGPDGADMTSADGVGRLFAHPLGVVIGWAHYLVFDLFVGAWEARDAKRRGLSHWALVPCLVLTFAFGPVGLLLYLVVRKLTGKGGFSLAEA